MAKFNLQDIVRDNIKKLKPYSSARSEFSGTAEVFLDANENPYEDLYGQKVNRYPDPYQLELKKKISVIKNIPPDQIFLGNGSDEAIDLLFRIFCMPGKDNIIINPPTYGMYEVSANINDVAVRKIFLTDAFQIDLEKVSAAIDDFTKLIFFCCPNNPTGTSLKASDIFTIATSFSGIVIVDEAYIDFADYNSLIFRLDEFPNLVILQTFSKAWGMAGLRLGMAFASKEIIQLFNKVKPPYNISSITQQFALNALTSSNLVSERINEIKIEREKLFQHLGELRNVITVIPSQANFLLVKFEDAKSVYAELCKSGIVVRDRSNVELCDNALRITIGTPVENSKLIDALKKLYS